ncbi:MAG TPA: hypothetical protein EYN61_02295 [Chromatiaceae bacterium]|nr:hypothetical protein [Chromatiaceae bacterium]HIO14003.1 hypothetical protein [Chromatiales bacterium]
MKPPREITWLASYPKSGNTWMRFLLYGYFHGSVGSSAEIAAAIPDIHTLPDRRLPDQMMGNHLIKTHFLWNKRHPDHENTQRAIYLIRHPKDVLLSTLQYFRLLFDGEIVAESFARRFIELKGAPYWIDQGVGSLLDNVMSWTMDQELSHIVVRYEDMHADIYTEFGRVLRFLGVEPDLVAMQSAIDGASFDRMKLLEERERADEEYGTVFQVHPRQSQGNARFMNRGKVGQSLGDISSELDSLFDEVFADHLQTYGYV